MGQSKEPHDEMGTRIAFLFVIIISFCFCVFATDSSSGQFNEISNRVRQKRDICMPKLPCLCEGNVSTSDGKYIYETISCFGWNGSLKLDLVPLARELLLQCDFSDQQKRVNLSRDTFRKFNTSLERLILMGCRIGTFPTDTLTGLVALQRLEIQNGELDARSLPGIIGVSTNASIRLFNCLEEIRSLDNDSFGALESNVSSLDLSFNNLQMVGGNPFAVMPSLKKLFLNHNNISTISEEAFDGLHILEDLYLGNNANPIKNDQCLFRRISSLVKLNVASMGVRNVSSFSCAPLPNIRELVVNGNWLSSLPNRAFASMPNVSSIDISNNSLSYIDDYALDGGLSSLSVMNMSRNHITELPPITLFQNTPKITEIDVSHNRLSVIRRGTFNGLPLLQKVYLSYNDIYIIERQAFIAIDLLNFVDLRRNKFTDFPINLIWPSLEIYPPHIPIEFRFGGNTFSCGCEDLYRMRTGFFLKYTPEFMFADNSTWVCHAPPPVAGQMVMTLPLEDFWCQNKSFCPSNCRCYQRELDKDNVFFCYESDLETLPPVPEETVIFNCTSCLLDEHPILEADDIQAGSDLEVLVLRSIGLRTISPASLKDLSNLRELDFSRNNLTEVKGSILANVTSLRTVDLSFNQISSLSLDSFETNSEISAIYLHNNDLESLPDGVFNYSTNLKALTLHENPFVCNCSLFWLKQWLQANLRIVGQDSIYNVTCFVNSSAADVYPIINVVDRDFGCGGDEVHILSVQEYTAVGITVALTLLILVSSAIAIRHRRVIRIILYTRYGFHVVHGEDNDLLVEEDRWEYDAYLAYSDDDVEFVLQSLLPTLEGEVPPFKLCIRHRDFPPGACIATTIVTSIEASRRCIVLLSRAFLEDEWRLLEFKTAHQRVLQDKRNKNLILIFLEDLPREEMDEDLRYYITANAFMRRQDRLFREKLLYEMPKHPLAENHLMIDENVQ